MAKLISNRLQQVQAPVVPIVAKMIQETPGTISLGQGVVHYGPPEEALGCLSCLDGSVHRYGPTLGNARLRELIAGKLQEENRIPCEASNVVFTAGSNMAFLNAILAIADVGDEIILPSPYYFNHRMAIEIAGCRCITCPTLPDYQLDLDALSHAINDRTRAIVTVSPNNPTGAVYSSSDLTEVNALCERHGLFHISDEAYEYFVYEDAQHFSPGSLAGASKHTISIYTFSKAHGIAGWRCGYMLVPAALLPAIQKIQDTNLVCPPSRTNASPKRCWSMVRIGAKPKSMSLPKHAE